MARRLFRASKFRTPSQTACPSATSWSNEYVFGSLLMSQCAFAIGVLDGQPIAASLRVSAGQGWRRIAVSSASRTLRASSRGENGLLEERLAAAPTRRAAGHAPLLVRQLYHRSGRCRPSSGAPDDAAPTVGRRGAADSARQRP